MLTSEFDFPFPQSQVAYRPAARGESLLMVVSRMGRLPADFPLPVEPEGWAFGTVSDLVKILKPGDALALNETKVIRARLHGHLPDGTACRVIVTRPRAPGLGFEWEAIVSPHGKAAAGMTLAFKGGLTAEVVEILNREERTLKFNLDEPNLFAKLEEVGEIPLPEYLNRDPDAEDEQTYQSVFAKNPGSIAAPTASLHFSSEMLDGIESRGVSIAKITLHVGIGTFRSVQSIRIDDHPMHSESYTLTREAADVLNSAHKNRCRVFAVGTTAARTLETCAEPSRDGWIMPRMGETSLFIRPGYQWKAVDGLLTNFHFPRSTLFMLVASLVGTRNAKAAYAEAIRRGFRLFSYGDAMLIL